MQAKLSMDSNSVSLISRGFQTDERKLEEPATERFDAIEGITGSRADATERILKSPAHATEEILMSPADVTEELVGSRVYVTEEMATSAIEDYGCYEDALWYV